MSFNQSKGEKNEYQYRKTGRSGNSANNNQRSNFQGSTGGGKGGGGNAPPPQSSSSLNSNKSFNKRSGNNGQGGGQSRVNVSNSYSEVNNTSSVARPGQNGAHVQPPLSGISDGPAPGVVPKPTTTPPAPRSARPAPKAPSSQSTTGIADSVAPSTPAKADMPKSFQLQFGSISPGVVNGMQIPARTSSAPPNLDEQKRDQARHDSVRAAPTMPITSGSKQQQPPKEPGSNKQSVTREPHTAPSHARREVHTHVPPASGTTVSQKPSVLPIPGISMSVPFQSQVSVPFGGSISHIQSQGISTTSVPMPIPLPVGSAGQMPQQVFVPTHPLQTQGIIPQGPNLNFPTPIGHQMPPPIGNMGMGVSPQFPQQQAGKFGALRKAVKITHPETHEELKLDKRMDLYMDGVSSGPRSQPNAPPQSQPVPTFTPPHFNYYPPMQTNSYYFSAPQTAVPLPNTQMTTGPQTARYNYSVGQGLPTVTYKNPASLNPLPSAKNGSQVHSSAEASNIEHAHDPQTVTVSTPSPSVPFTVKPAAVSTGTSSVTSSAPVIEKVESPKLLRAPKEGSTLQSHSAIASAAVSAPRLSTSASSSATASLSEECASVMTGPEGRPKEIIKRSESFKDRQKKGGKKDTRNAQFQNQEDTSPRLSRDVKKGSDTMQSPPPEMVESSSSLVSSALQGLKHANSLNDGNSVDGHASLGTSGKTLVPSARPLPDPSDSESNDIQNQDGDISRIASKETDLHSEGTILDNLDVPEHSKQDLGEVQLKRECRTVEENTELIEGSKDSSNNLEMLSEPTSEFSEGNSQMGVDCDVKDTTAEQKSEGVDHCNSEVESITGNLVNYSDSVDAQTAPSSSDSSTSSHDDKTSNDSSSICNNHRDSQDPHTDLTTVTSDDSLKDETKILESISSGDLISTSVSVSKDKTTSETNRGKSNTAKVKKKLKDILKAADATGSTSDLYMAYKGPEEKQENLATSENADNSSGLDSKQAPADDKEKDTTAAEEDGQTKAEPDDWEDAADMSTPKLKPSGNQTEDGKNSKKYSRDFLLTLSEQCTDLPAGFEIGTDIAEALMSVQMGISHLVEREMYLNTGRIDRASGGPRPDRRGSGMVEEDKWNKSPGSFISGRDPRLEVGHGGPVVGIRPGQGGNHGGVLRNPRGQATGQYVSGILSGPMQSLASQGGMQRSHSDADRWQRQKGLIPSPQTPLQVMHKAEKKYEIHKVSDAEEAKQRQLKGILNKLTPQNFEKLFEQVKEVNIDNAVTLTGVISQIFDKALMEPTFCEMYANFCSHLAGELPDFSEDNEKITFKRLLLNKCQEEFERGEREQAEADRVEEEGEVKCSEEEREEKRIQARRRMLGNIRLIGELYKKRMLTERIMHECIKKLLGQHQNQNPDEEDVEALCKLMSTIGEMIDHPKAREHMDAYFEIMSKFSNNMRVSSRVRFMLKDSIDLRKNKWQQRRKVEGPKKIDEVHRDAAQERHAQATRLARGPSMGNSARRGQPMDFSPRGSTVMTSPNSQMGSFRGYPSQVRGYVQDVRMDERHSFESRTFSVPLSQRPLDDNSITLGPQGGLARGMSVRGQPLMSGVPLVDMTPVDPRRFAAGPNGYSSTLERTPYGREETLPRYPPERSIPMPAYDQSNLQERSAYPGRDLRSSDRSLDRSMVASASHVQGASTAPLALVAPEKNLSEERLRDKCFSAIREFYSAKDKEEVALCIKELNSPSFYPSMVSIWVTDSFERKDLERDLLAKLLVDLTKPRDSLLNPFQLIKGFESVLATLEDAVNDAPKAAEFLGHILAKVILENVVPLRDIGRLIHEGGEEPGRLLEVGLASEVLGSILEIIRSEKGDSVLNEMCKSSNLRLEDFRPPDPIKSRK